MRFKKVFMFLMALCVAVSAKTISLDQDNIVVEVENNKMNLLEFPFTIQSARLSTEDPEGFVVNTKNKSLVVFAQVIDTSETADILLYSMTGEPFLIKIKPTGNQQKFKFTSNKVSEESAPMAAKQFETGKIEKDITNIIKKVANDEALPGYSKVNVKKQFITPDLEMQKEFFYDGGKYRVETWFVKNTTNVMLTLDYANFYTTGILAMAFESNTLSPGQVGKMWMIINKASVAEQLKLNNLK